MAILSFQFDTGAVNTPKDVVDGICYLYGYLDMINPPEGGPPVPNPQTRAAFAKEQVRQFLISALRAKKAADAAALNGVEKFTDFA
jgi:hypothetical protein